LALFFIVGYPAIGVPAVIAGTETFKFGQHRAAITYSVGDRAARSSRCLAPSAFDSHPRPGSVQQGSSGATRALHGSAAHPTGAKPSPGGPRQLSLCRSLPNQNWPRR